MNIEKVILSKYPNAIPNVDFFVVDRLDGNGAQIMDWSLQVESGEDVPQPTQNDLASWWIPIYQQEKMNELNQACNGAILAGFSSACLGTSHTYQFSYDDQLNLNGQLTLINADPTITTLQWKTMDAGVLEHSRDQFIALCKDAIAFKQSQIQKYWSLKAQVLAATTEDQIDAITW
jgi:hypothetical protein